MVINEYLKLKKYNQDRADFADTLEDRCKYLEKVASTESPVMESAYAMW